MSGTKAAAMATPATDGDGPGSAFECNVCLETAVEPVITL
jgi:hypothetical protein